eukprot:CAMPEP_0203668180 /NCGR_PEP_ID=MMETSP0090-20130426/4873_1 /ASSEMBLY_ACC=CAM_ASM_001088 /TAXON_ID=426623 /ORGANISM="Chaetoceros affinis, Strain CCMP159" /LENGTH=332 /DNA_ID=CAMNT_0050532549 /DNA_START=82 /DNA_END=1077 /DNA_ORIENTATION=+
MSAELGIIYAIASAIFNGSFTTLFKTRRMVDLSIHPIIFQLYVSCGVFLSSWLVIPFVHMNREGGGFFSFCMGLLAGALFIFAVYASFQAIDYIGIALAQGIWGGIAMVVSYIWGVCFFHENPSNTFFSIFALFLLVAGVISIASCERVGTMLFGRISLDNTSVSEVNLLLQMSIDGGIETGDRLRTPQNSSNYIRGVLWAISVGIFGGSILAPMHYADDQGLMFLPSFGIGAILTAPLVLLVHFLCTKEVPAFHWKEALLPGISSGVIYNAGNALSMMAISSIGYYVAYPILQCAILVSGVWGICLFREITNRKSIIAFFIGGFTLLMGGL